MAKYQQYEEYKNTGSKWVPEIPIHWEPILFKRVIDQIKDGTHGTHARVNEGFPFLSAKNVLHKGIEISDSESMISEKDYKEITANGFPKKDDLLITCVGTIGRTCVYEFDEPYAFQRSVAFLRLSELAVPKFYKYFVESKTYQSQLEANSKASAQSGVYMGDLVSTSTVLPPKDEQIKIANFLDHETAQIDTLIDKQQTLIQLLKEKRQAVISHAVTKGLNPDAPMKDSGVEWLGEVPEHWRVCSLKHIKAKQSNAFVDGPFGSNLKSIHFVDDGDIFVIESNFATTGIIDESKLKNITLSHFNTISRSEAKAGDIIIAKIGARFGMSSILPKLTKRSVVSGNSLKLTLDSDICNTEYIKFLLQHLKNEGAMDDGVNVTAQPALSLGGLNNLPVLLPPYSEQNAVIEELHRLLYKLSDLTNHAEQAIQLMQERRTALISAAVTGKIDVRGWVAPE